tara:strand:- start:2 stop:664 length:663 start_codon:yes stop_codon:yes gene_type:complete
MFKNLELNSKIAELIGMHIGDGTLYKTNWSLVWELRGGLNEKDYYFNNVKPLLESIFKNLEFYPKFRSGGKNGCFGIQTSKKDVTNLFLQFGFKPGRKTHTVKVPEYIYQSNIKIKLAFLRGIFDTDGCIRFDRINNQKLHTYPRVEIGSASKDLRDGLARLLKILGFRYFIWGKDCYMICVGGKEQSTKWFKIIKPANKKHLNRFNFWMENGYHNAEVA